MLIDKRQDEPDITSSRVIRQLGINSKSLRNSVKRS